MKRTVYPRNRTGVPAELRDSDQGGMTVTDKRKLDAHRAMWTNRGQARPSFADEPGPGQESVWDYPRPPAVVPDDRLVEVRAGKLEIARTRRAVRILETASPPTFYIPREDVDMEHLYPAAGGSMCEWKGMASYFDVGRRLRKVARAAWSYEQPFEEMQAIAGHISFYPGRLECFVDGQRVRPQDGGFYGGWVTDEIVGPWKGSAGTGGW